MKENEEQAHFDKLFWYEYDEAKLIEPQLLFERYGLELHLTSGAFPEQYEVYKKGTEEQVGYLRLRHGEFRVDFPECGEETIFHAQPSGDGLFDEDERMPYLTAAMNAILNKLNSDKNPERSVAREDDSSNSDGQPDSNRKVEDVKNVER